MAAEAGLLLKTQVLFERSKTNFETFDTGSEVR